MLASVLSYFDAKIGPKILMQSSELPDYIRFEHIPLLMDFYSGDFFTHEFGDLKTANLIFSVPNPKARGSVESLMISIITLDDKLQKLSSFKEILQVFAREFENIKDVHLGIHKNSQEDEVYEEKFKEIENFFNTFYNSLPKEKAVFKSKISRILLFGLPQSGKSSIIKCLQQKIFNKSVQRKEISLRKSLLGNLSITTFSFSDKNFFSEIITIYLKNIDGLVFVLDAADKTNFDNAKRELHEINKFPESFHLPLLILVNKIDLKTPKVENIIQTIKIDDLKHDNMKYFPISAKKNKGVTEAFNWLLTEITNEIIKNPIIYFS